MPPRLIIKVFVCLCLLIPRTTSAANGDDFLTPTPQTSIGSEGTEALSLGDLVVVVVAFETDSIPPKVLEKGLKGVIKNINKDGNLYITFALKSLTSSTADERVSKANLHKLRKEILVPGGASCRSRTPDTKCNCQSVIEWCWLDPEKVDNKLCDQCPCCKQFSVPRQHHLDPCDEDRKCGPGLSCGYPQIGAIPMSAGQSDDINITRCIQCHPGMCRGGAIQTQEEGHKMPSLKVRQTTESSTLEYVLVSILVVIVLTTFLGSVFACRQKMCTCLRTSCCSCVCAAVGTGSATEKREAPAVYDESENDVAEDNATGLAEESVLFPHYWTNAKHPDSTAFNQMIYASKNHLPKFGELLSRTFRAKATQDRPCPKGTHPRTPGGCECVQVAGDPGLPAGFQVRRVIRIESSAMWRRYLHRREEIEAKHESLAVLDPPVHTGAITSAHGDMFEPIAANQNETYIMHGTHVRKALAIAQDHFKIDMAGSTRGSTMYGPGAYFAESSTKADEYAMDDPGGYYEGIYALLLCRACLGRFYYTTERDEKAHEKVANGEFDSTLGDRLKSADTFREFVIYDADQLYPEYVVLYSRIPKGGATLPNDADALFHMEVPVYWRNCHLDPHQTAFHDHYIVRNTIVEALQRLVTNTSRRCEGKLIVLSARRVENSSTWAKYLNFKRSLRQTLNEEPGKMFAKAEELLAKSHSESQVLTHKHLRHENNEEAISLDNIEESLNEHLVWHGTGREAAEAIAYDDFLVPWASKQRHGQRFGMGVYFSDCLDKSLTYATPEENGTRHVLLCRMLCGDVYYTEDEWDESATDNAKQSCKTSVLVNPSKGGAREFVALTEQQVYPEYILQLRIDKYPTDEMPASDGHGANADCIGHTDLEVTTI